MEFVTKLFIKNYWLLSLTSYALIAFISYGFIQNLFFWREDFAQLYHLNQGESCSWPDQGACLVFFPLYFLFSLNPQGYFLTVLVLYTIAALILNYFVLQFTNRKLPSYLAGLIFASGYIGSENLFMMGVGINSFVYFLLSFFTIIFYYQGYKRISKPVYPVFVKRIVDYLQIQSFKFWLLSFITYFLAITFSSRRAHSLIFLLLLTDLFWVNTKLINQKSKLLSTLKGLVVRLSVFVVITLLVYLSFPSIFIVRNRNIAGFETPINLSTFDMKSNLSFLSSLGNFLISSDLQKLLLKKLNEMNVTATHDLNLQLVLGSLFGVILVAVICMFLIAQSVNRTHKKLLAFFFLSFVLSYIVYHLREFSRVHESWHRYLLFPYPFFSAAVALVASILLVNFKNNFKKLICILIFFGLVGVNIFQNVNSPFKKEVLQRSLYSARFFQQLKEMIPKIEEDDIIFFDVVSDPIVTAMFGKIVACGSCSTEMTVAAMYKINEDHVKAVVRWDDVISAAGTKKYKYAYAFFYDRDYNLKFRGRYEIENGKLKTFTPSQNFTNKNDKNKQKITLNKAYTTRVIKSDNGSYFENKPLHIKIDPIPIAWPVEVKLSVSSQYQPPSSSIFYPLQERIAGGKQVDDIDFDQNGLDELPEYLDEKLAFRKNTKITTNNFEHPWDAKYLIDGDLATHWMASKKDWAVKNYPYIEVDFLEDLLVAEIRWVSGYSTRFPISYEYQISGDRVNWRTISVVDKQQVVVDKYVIDDVPQTPTRYLRMVITDSSSDFPAISEFIVLKKKYSVDSDVASYIRQHPLLSANSHEEANTQLRILENYQYIKLSPLSDKYSDDKILRTYKTIFSPSQKNYTFIINPVGNYLRGFILNFPNIPIDVMVESVTLKTLNPNIQDKSNE